MFVLGLDDEHLEMALKRLAPRKTAHRQLSIPQLKALSADSGSLLPGSALLMQFLSQYSILYL
jgi:hypothetical protein